MSEHQPSSIVVPGTVAPTQPAREKRALTPGQLAWRRLRRNKIAMTGAILLLLLYAIAVFAGFLSPYAPTTDEFRSHFFHPPTNPAFTNADGSFSLRPRVPVTHVVDTSRLIYAAGTPLIIQVYYPQANFSPFAQDLLEATESAITAKTDKGEELGSVFTLKETARNSGIFAAVMAIDTLKASNAKQITVETSFGARRDFPVIQSEPAQDSNQETISLLDLKGRPVTAYYPRIDYRKIKFFVRTWRYKILWIFESDLHLFGVDAPAHVFLFGTDQSGRDIFSRVLYGAQISLTVGLLGVFITTVFGLIFGGIAGYYGGALDNVIMRFAEILMSIPALYLILSLRNIIPERMQELYDKIYEIGMETFAWQNNPAARWITFAFMVLLASYYYYRTKVKARALILGIPLLVAAGFGRELVDGIMSLIQAVVPGTTRVTSQWTYIMIILILSLVAWAAMSRVIRGMVLTLREQEYVAAARSLGASDFRIIARHILPNTFGYVIVRGTLLIPAYILGEVALSFLGVGVQEPVPSWGNMLSAAQSLRVLQQFTWTITPGFFIFITVLAYNFFGDGLRDALDPKRA